MKTLIIGGVAGGASVAARLRRLDEQAEIVILERGPYISFANCGLPYYIGDVIRNKEDLVLQTPESFNDRFNVDVRILSEAVAIHPETKTVTVRNLQTDKTYEESYDNLVLSPGAEPVRPQIGAENSERIFTLRNIPDTYKIKDFLVSHEPKSAIVIGGGYIGLEMAENLTHAGLFVTLIQRSNQVLRNTLDYDMACEVHNQLYAKGVDIAFNQTLQGFAEKGDQIVVTTQDNEYTADMVLLSIGVRPESKLAADAGIEVDQKGYIITNDRMETSIPGIYALGDAVEVTHFVTGAKAAIPLAGPANKQGRIVADNIAGIPSTYQGTQGTSVLKCFDLTVAATGINEAAAQHAGIDYIASITYSEDHASYYPGSTKIAVKLLFTPDEGKILGAQLVGKDGVDKRCDVVATAIRAGMTVYDLTRLELSYAPPFSSAKDPINMAGYVAENILTKKIDIYHIQDLPKLDRDKVTILDVMTDKEYQKGHIPGSINIPVDELRGRISELDPSKPVYVNCAIGLRGYVACRMLMQHGFTCKNLSGGYKLYKSVEANQE